MDILITGATGLVGTHLCHQLKKYNLYPVSRSSSKFPFDISNKRRLLSAFNHKSLDAIIHLANPSDWHHHQPDYYLPTNIVGTLNLLELAKLKQAKFIFTSSQMVYGARHVTRGLSETLSPQPTDWYGLSKYAAEQYTTLYHSYYHFPVVILRPAGIFGHNDTRTVLGKFIHLATTGQPLTISGQGKTKRHFIHVQDVVTAISQCLHRKQGLEVINIGSLQIPSLYQLASYIARLTNVSLIRTGEESRLDFYLNTHRQQQLFHLKPDIFLRIKQELTI